MYNSKRSNVSPHTDHRLLDFEDLTPMYRHYINIKEEYISSLLLYRVGDFFECFFHNIDHVVTDYTSYQTND